MKRILVMLVSLALVGGSVATAEAAGGKRMERTVTGSYGAFPAPVTGCNSPLGSFACLTVDTRAQEAYFTAKVTDAHGQPVFVEVTSSSGQDVVFCGETPKPIAIQPGSQLSFHVGLNNWLLTTDCPTNRVKTTGTLSVTLSNQP